MTSYDKHLDTAAMVQGIEPELGRLRTAVEQKVRTAVSSSTTGELLTLTLTSGEVLTPAPNTRYVKKLVEYLRGKGDVQSAAVEDVALAAARQAVAEFYTSDATLAALSSQILRQLEVNASLREQLLREMGTEAAWLGRELKGTLGGAAQHTVTARVVEGTTHAVSAAFNTVAGQAIAGVAAKALAVPTVKAALIKAIIVAANSLAFQKMLMLAVKKVGIAVLAQVFLAKAAAAGGGAAVPGLGWIVSGLILAMLTYDYLTLPEKLGNRLGTDLAASLADPQNRLHAALAATFGQVALEEVARVARSSR